MYFLVLLSALLACAAGVPFNNAKPKQDERIVGGNPTTIENHPHQVSLQNFGSFICGGSIISPTCVVTAAHCVRWANAKDLTIRAGSTLHASDGTVHNVTGGFYHGSYDDYIIDYDVAVLRVDPPFTFTNSVQNITLEDSEKSVGTTVVVTGWGATWPGGYDSYDLLEAFVQIRDIASCNETYSGDVTDRMICAGSPSAYEGPCFGDSGGPLTTLYCPRKLVGIVSWGPWDCGNPAYPAVYTKVSAVRDWIIHLCTAQIIPKGITRAVAIP